MKEEKFVSFLVRLKRKKGVWVGAVSYIQKNVEKPIRGLAQIQSAIEKMLKEDKDEENEH